MPKGFLKCIRKGGKVYTKKLGGRQYRHICSLGGKTFKGHIKKRKKK